MRTRRLTFRILTRRCNCSTVQEGRYPKTLEELTPNYVAKIPEAPLGYQIDYNATKGEVKVVKQ